MNKASPQARVEVINRTRTYDVEAGQIQKLANFICRCLRVEDHVLSVTFTGTRAIRTLNHQYRNKDTSTDVLSFPQKNWSQPRRLWAPMRRKPIKKAVTQWPADLLGDIVISLPNAARNAHKIGQPLSREVVFLLVHGILHLCGYDHVQRCDEMRMLAAQQRILTWLGGRAAPRWDGSVKYPRRPPGII